MPSHFIIMAECKMSRNYFKIAEKRNLNDYPISFTTYGTGGDKETDYSD